MQQQAVSIEITHLACNPEGGRPSMTSGMAPGRVELVNKT